MLVVAEASLKPLDNRRLILCSLVFGLIVVLFDCDVLRLFFLDIFE